MLNKSQPLFALLLGITLLLTTPALAKEIWLEPVPVGAETQTTVGDWAVTGKADTHFRFGVPNDFDVFTRATLVVIGKKSRDMDLDVLLSISQDIMQHDMLTRSLSLPAVPLVAGELLEIDISVVFPALAAGMDYVGLEVSGFRAADGHILGLRFIYDSTVEGDLDAEEAARMTGDNHAGDVFGPNTDLQIGANSVGAPELAATAVTPGSYGSGTEVSQITVDADGRITAATNVTITEAAPSGTAGGDLSGTYPNPTIGANTVGTNELQDNSVTEVKLDFDTATQAELDAEAVLRMAADAADPDTDPTNELNTNVALVGNELQVTDAGGIKSADLSNLIPDADADPTNELNTNVALVGNELQVTDAGGIKSADLSGLIPDADADPTNELNIGLALMGSSLQITDAGGSLAADLSSLVTTVGLTEINQALAVAGGVTTGDTPGFPVTINESGSYILTSNLTVPVDTTAIKINLEHVTINLNGFTIIGPNLFSGTGQGVDGFTQQSITVVNGTVRGMGNMGVNLGNLAYVENVRAIHNVEVGIRTGLFSRVIGNTAIGNAGVPGIGIFAGKGSTVTGNTAFQNAFNGIFVGPGSTVTGNTASGQHGGAGIVVGNSSTVTGNSSNHNFGSGIDTGIAEGGFRGGSTVTGNAAHSNGGFGLEVFNSGYGNNVLTGNNGGDANPQVDAGGIEIGTNVCGTNTTCP